MGLDITFRAEAPVYCPHCGKVTSWETIAEKDSCGRHWYDFLDEIGYTDKDEEGDCIMYGKDMVLTPIQVKRLSELSIDVRYWRVRSVVTEYYFRNDCRIVVNADW